MRNNLQLQTNSRKVKYLHWSLLLVISLVIAHLIVTESQKKPMLVLIHQFNYKVAMAFSWTMTFAIMYWINWCTRFLDTYRPWTGNWIVRTLIQFVLGVLAVLIFDILVVKGYFDAFNRDFRKSGYMEVEFPIVRLMVLLMNVTNIAWFFAANYYHTKRKNEELGEFIKLLTDKEQQQKFYRRTIKAHLGNRIILVELNEIACFAREDNIGYVYLLDGHKFNIDLKLYQLNALLDSSSFYQINRSVIISLDIVKGFEKVKNQQAAIILKEGNQLEVSLLVSRDRFEGFKERFDTYRMF
ncbi:LytR/AlgR family response regulator transcription factor [Pedobacter cryotolerans]|uniref:LytTR family transcriptional regulator n=1 Tax=Pedobacter cryotolerans TaxID=2571270 RepID=A0A4U1C495_9SPHI|nr:LytTR family DNA-binding domain-containing protein [Pedobacter cryotolerans]TKC00020.1 LytTR family transcriptional regulator [Pedobacter cryotolerans]